MQGVLDRRRGAPKDSFLRDLSHARLIAESAWLVDRSQWIGKWHTHPAGGLAPSAFDLRSYLRHLFDPDLGLERFIAIVVGVGPDIDVATWMIERDGAWQADLLLR